MDAPLRRRLLAASLLTALSGTGCGMLSHEADRKVEEAFADTSLPRRGQAPDGPKAPATLPPPERTTPATLPVPSRPDAPVVPLDPGKPVITPVAAAEGRPAAAQADSAVRVIVTVGADNIITDDEVSMMMKQRARDYVALKGEERERKEKEVYTEELKKLIDRELILTEFLGRVKKNNPGALEELWEQAGKMADSHMREMRRAFKIKTEAEFTAELERQGLPYKLFRRQVERNALMNMFLNTVLKDKNGTPTLAQVQDYYARHADEFKTDDRIKFQHLFVATSQFDSPAAAKQRAEELWNTARRGGDFVQLVKDHGHGDSKLREGAGVGEKRGEIQPPELEKVVWEIKPGNFSGVIPSENGYHVVKVIERDVAGTRPLDEKLQTDIRNKLTDQAIKVEREKLTAHLWRQVGVTIEGGK